MEQLQLKPSGHDRGEGVRDSECRVSEPLEDVVDQGLDLRGLA